MKKIILYCVFSSIILLFIGCEKRIERFNIEEYEKYINNNEYKYYKGNAEKNIENEYDAKDMAERIWREVYGEYVKKEKPYVVMRDEKNGAWLVHSVYKKNVFGGVSWIIMNDKGNVLAVWRDK